MRHIGVVGKEFVATLRMKHKDKERYKPIPTGIEALDKEVGGVGDGAYWAWGGTAKIGKTTVILNVGVELSKTKKVGLFCLEERDIQAVARLLARETQGVDRKDMYTLNVDEDGFVELDQAVAILETYNMWVEDSVFDLDKIFEICEKEGIEVAIIDYMNLLNYGKFMNESERLTAISRRTVQVKNSGAKAAELKGITALTVMLLYQLNDDLLAFGSRSVYKDADISIEISEALDADGDPIEGRIELSINRSRISGVVKHMHMLFSGAHCRIENIGDVTIDFADVEVVYLGDSKDAYKPRRGKAAKRGFGRGKQQPELISAESPNSA